MFIVEDRKLFSSSVGAASRTFRSYGARGNAPSIAINISLLRSGWSEVLRCAAAVDPYVGPYVERPDNVDLPHSFGSVGAACL
jgi:hypothetical protein